MLVLKDLDNRKYVDKKCVAFTFEMLNEKNEQMFEARWNAGKEENEWKMQIVLDRTRDADSQVYNFGYIMPRSGLPLELIAATGLRYFQLYLKEEIQSKMNIDFGIGEATRDM